jgi:anti-sigma regulatory factor (Ser/Thr protein kinase)
VRFTTVRDITWWIDQVASGDDGSEFDGPTFLRPFHFAVLAGDVHRKEHADINVPERLRGYAARMHLWQAIDLECPLAVTERDPEGKFHPLTAIRSEDDADVVADAIREVFRASGTRSRKTLNSIHIVLSEIAGNCFHHASEEPGIRGLVCAQTWPKGKLAQVVVADIGVGIRASLYRNPENHARLANSNAIKLATEYGVTGNPQGHSGYGLTLARELMEMHGGNFVVVSGDEAFRAGEHRARAQDLPHGWQGTIVVLEWKTDRPLNTTAVYRSWPDSEGELP